MSQGCNNKRIRQLLHLYELGVLPEDKQREVEEHLLGCSWCSQEVEKFNKVARLMKTVTRPWTASGHCVFAAH